MKKIAILGYGTTAKALVSLLNDQGNICDIFDDTFDRIIKSGKNTLFPSSAYQADQYCFTITSPGIPPSHPLIMQAKNLMSEYDYFYKYLQGEGIFISGTNGKTTTTEMLEFLLRDKDAKAGGNIGYPLAKLAREKPKIWILETSSFSLHYTKMAYPKCYILLPVREDHIAWHHSFENYVNVKLSPLSRMTEKTFAFIPDALKTHVLCTQARASIYYYKDAEDIARQCNFSLKECRFKEPFLLDATLALCATTILYQQTDIGLLNQYKIGKHRIEEFKDVWGFTWVDDSKGTNVDATCEALKCYQNQKIHLILGGDDKGASQEPIFTLIKDLRIDIKLYLIGTNAQKLKNIAAAFKIESIYCGTLKMAVRMIKKYQKLDDIGILSPAAASLDQFSSYQERGKLFKKFVMEEE